MTLLLHDVSTNLVYFIFAIYYFNTLLLYVIFKLTSYIFFYFWTWLWYDVARIDNRVMLCIT